MAVVEEMRLGISRTVNLGNMEFVKIEAFVSMFREESDPNDSAGAMCEDLMDEVRTLLDAATEEHVPKKSGR